MKKILFVAYYFPPVVASGGMRPLAFCRFLEPYGWGSRVLTTDPASVYPPHPVDPQLSSKIPCTVRVDAVPHGNPLQRVVAWRERLRALLLKGRYAEGQLEGPGQGHSNKPNPQGGVFSSTKRLLLDWTFEFPDPQCAWLSSVTAYAKRMSRAEIPDIVFATGGPWTSLLAGRRLAESWRVPFIADYRDPWTSNPYVSFASAWLNAEARRLEESVVRTASRVITNTHELRLQLQKDYPGLVQKALTITNGFDPDSFSGFPKQMRPDQGGDTRTARTAVELCHFGTVYGKRTPTVLFQALLDLHQSGRVSSSEISLRFVGSWEVNEAKCEEQAQRLEKLGFLKREPPVPYQACLQQMKEADALLVIQPDSPLQIPGKIYEYIATRRPLLLIGGEGATAGLVRRHRLGLVCSNNGAQIHQLILDMVEGRQSLPAPVPEEVDRFNYRSLTEDLAKVLDEVHQARAMKSA